MVDHNVLSQFCGGHPNDTATPREHIMPVALILGAERKKLSIYSGAFCFSRQLFKVDTVDVSTRLVQVPHYR